MIIPIWTWKIRAFNIKFAKRFSINGTSTHSLPSQSKSGIICLPFRARKHKKISSSKPAKRSAILSLTKLSLIGNRSGRNVSSFYRFFLPFSKFKFRGKCQRDVDALGNTNREMAAAKVFRKDKVDIFYFPFHSFVDSEPLR